ncbi:hypothetical protein DFH07DRAFT_439180 [Mycena maculata]|uniref:Uncharacterized protein n=1 Tax=Mycena maculata TaxID=230809 RepID=A0AAD7KAV2_9AGAR|nr:hypothetical protein DFH07DRAFT_439180 [Mycena maculata]
MARAHFIIVDAVPVWSTFHSAHADFPPPFFQDAYSRPVHQADDKRLLDATKIDVGDPRVETYTENQNKCAKFTNSKRIALRNFS